MGIYNLPKKERDAYNNNEIDFKAFYEKTIAQKTKRLTKTLIPQNDESLLLYVSRLRANLDELEEQSNNEHMYGPKGPWYVHKRAQNCFICDYNTMIHQQLDILIDILHLLPKPTSRLAFASTKEGSQRLVTISKA